MTRSISAKFTAITAATLLIANHSAFGHVSHQASHIHPTGQETGLISAVIAGLLFASYRLKQRN